MVFLSVLLFFQCRKTVKVSQASSLRDPPEEMGLHHQMKDTSNSNCNSSCNSNYSNSFSTSINNNSNNNTSTNSSSSNSSMRFSSSNTITSRWRQGPNRAIIQESLLYRIYLNHQSQCLK